MCEEGRDIAARLAKALEIPVWSVFVSFFNGRSDTSTVGYIKLDKKMSVLIRLKEPLFMQKTGAMDKVLIVGNRTVCLSCTYFSCSNIFKIELRGINVIVDV